MSKKDKRRYISKAERAVIQQKKEEHKLEAQRLEADRLEAERIEAEKKEAERLEAERLEAEKKEAERLEAERLEAEKKEAERLEAERLEAEKKEAEKLAAQKAEAKEEPKKEEPKKEEPKKEEPKKEEPKKEEPKKEEPKKEEPKKETPRKEAPAKLTKEEKKYNKEFDKVAKQARIKAEKEAKRLDKENRKAEKEAERDRKKAAKNGSQVVKTAIIDPEEKKKATFKDWLIIGLSIISILLLIYIVYSTKSYDNYVSDRLQADSQKENLTVVLTTNAIDSVKISEVNAEKWIELYNSSSDDVDISGMGIYVSGNKVAVVADETIIPTAGYLVFELDSNPAAGQKNVISLEDKDGNQVDSMIVPALTASQSYGITLNENFNAGYIEATKGAQNPVQIAAESYTYVDGIGFSTPGGFYDSAFSLALSSKNGEKIYYTTDGTVPTAESTEYTGEISIRNQSGRKYVYAAQGFGYLDKETYYPNSVDAGMVINAITVDGSGKITGSASQEYYIGLANDTAYANIPVISLNVDPDGMFGYFNGMYVPGRAREDALISGNSELGPNANYSSGWTREGQVAFFETDKAKSLENKVSVKMYEDENIAQRQKSFQISFSDTENFKGSSLLKYLDADGNLILQGYLEDEELRVRDYIANELLKDTSIGTLDMSPCILFIDGEYWGVYLMKAPFDANYIYRHYGVTEPVYVRTHKAYQSDFNNMYNYVTRNDMSSPQRYSAVKQLMDMDNYIEYICANAYLGNSSMRTTQGTQWRTVKGGGKGYNDGRWRWLMKYPVGNTMAHAATQTPSIDTLIQGSLRTDRFFQSLLMNKEFQQKLEETMDRMANEVFVQEKWEPVVDQASELMKKPSIESYVRFYGSMKDVQYNDGIDKIKDFFMNRSEYITYYAKELAQKGGDLAYIDELEAQGKSVEDFEATEDEESQEGEGESEELTDETNEGGENAGNAENAGTTQNAAGAAEQGVDNSNG